MQYKEDRWDVQINPINLVQKNEYKIDWFYGSNDKPTVPAECNLFPPPEGLGEKGTLPEDWNRKVVQWNINDNMNKEVKLKDKWIKIRIRYKGDDLAVISAIKTFYAISYS